MKCLWGDGLDEIQEVDGFSAGCACFFALFFLAIALGLLVVFVLFGYLWIFGQPYPLAAAHSMQEHSSLSTS